MKQTFLALALAGAALLSGAAQAKDPTVYSSVAVAMSHAHMDDTWTAVDKNATGARVALGVEFNDYLAVEAAYTNYGTREVQFVSGGKQHQGDAEAKSYGLYLTASVPVTDRLSLFIQPGVLHTSLSTPVLGYAVGVARDQFDLGLGAQYALAPHVALTVGVHRIDKFANVPVDATTLVTGLKLRF